MKLRSPDHLVVTFEGVDALTFLQSQLTNDVAELAVGGWQWQGYCTAKGRLQATFALVRTASDVFSAVVHTSVATALIKRLTMFRMRSKLLIETSPTLTVMLHLSAPDAAAQSAVATLDLGHGRWVSVCHGDALAADASIMQRWNLLGVEARQPEIVAATAEMFVPQMILWDHVQPGGGVSFSKGCYPGQEVVARAHYRGAVKRRLELQTLPPDSSHAPGSETVLADGRSAEICNSAASASGATVALVVVVPVADTSA